MMTGTRSLCVFLLLLIPAISAESTGSEVTSCEACHERADCSTENSRVTCACTSGFTGNGLACYNGTLCGAAHSPCCNDGYHWSPEQGCVDIDECAAPVQPCLAPLVCKNTAGSFNCLLPPVNYNPTSSLRTVQFSCDSMVCNVGQDCLVIDGAARCLDPCHHYTVLDEAWRASNHNTSGDAECDMRVNWQGWYRMFLGGESVQMAERCLDPWTCGTQAPLWLKSPHPVVSDGIVQGNVCGSWTQGCCNFEFPIHVKACPGNYYVYKFVKPPLCFLAYGADVNTKVCGTCKNGENCVSEDKTHWKCEAETPIRLVNGANECQGRVELLHSGRWGTVCDDDWSLKNAEVVCRQLGCGQALEATTNAHFGAGSGPIWLDNVVCSGDEPNLPRCQNQGFEVHNCGHNEDAGVVCEEKPNVPNPEVVCASNYVQVGVPQNLHATTALNSLSGHLADPQCNIHVVTNGTVWYRVQRQNGVCGNVMKTNSTHAVLSNTLFVYPTMVNTSFALPVGFPFSCVYPLDMQTDLDVVVTPYLSMQEMGLVGFGPEARAVMSLYHNTTFNTPYPEGPVTLPVGSALNVGIHTEGIEEGTSFVVILEDCYTTNTSTPSDPIKHYFLKNRCISDPLRVTVLESGTSLEAHFSALLFLYQGSYTNTFVHCSLSLCDKSTSTCSTGCTTRKSRSITRRKALTVGPITLAKN